MKALTINDRLFTIFIYSLMALISISILYPLYFIVVASFTDPNVVNNGGILLYPSKLL
ncbi:hypothetical protein [Paenibacillus sp. JDR-2]|uniref:hypothetical protein n=1 Tax=Paenibacillus sp. (strain JDR-2) TaxID=324057 RepID=UPI000166A7AA|nr:hypothetical protein [Paenibacillus sp. JDR-2]ACT00493.1 hypothetical protein Pjdr2_1833 [Paenibacillus sp. JDR-2]